MELPRSVRWYRERSIIIAIACNEAGQTATKTGNILRGDGENTSGLERRRGRGGEGRGEGGGGASSREPSRLAHRLRLRLLARARACICKRATWGDETTDRVVGPLRRKRAERMSRESRTGGKRRTSEKTVRGEGTEVYVPPILITSSYKPTIQRSTATSHRRPP